MKRKVVKAKKIVKGTDELETISIRMDRKLMLRLQQGSRNARLKQGRLVG